MTNQKSALHMRTEAVAVALKVARDSTWKRDRLTAERIAKLIEEISLITSVITDEGLKTIMHHQV